MLSLRARWSARWTARGRRAPGWSCSPRRARGLRARAGRPGANAGPAAGARPSTGRSRAGGRHGGRLTVCLGLTVEGAGARRIVGSASAATGVLGRRGKVHLPPAERFAYTPGTASPRSTRRSAGSGCSSSSTSSSPRPRVLWRARAPIDRGSPPGRSTATSRAAPRPRQAQHFDPVDHARAIESQVVWVSANETGPWGDLRSWARRSRRPRRRRSRAHRGHRLGHGGRDPPWISARPPPSRRCGAPRRPW